MTVLHVVCTAHTRPSHNVMLLKFIHFKVKPQKFQSVVWITLNNVLPSGGPRLARKGDLKKNRDKLDGNYDYS